MACVCGLRLPTPASWGPAVDTVEHTQYLTEKTISWLLLMTSSIFKNCTGVYPGLTTTICQKPLQFFQVLDDNRYVARSNQSALENKSFVEKQSCKKVNT